MTTVPERLPGSSQPPLLITIHYIIQSNTRALSSLPLGHLSNDLKSPAHVLGSKLRLLLPGPHWVTGFHPVGSSPVRYQWNPFPAPAVTFETPPDDTRGSWFIPVCFLSGDIPWFRLQNPPFTTSPRDYLAFLTHLPMRQLKIPGEVAPHSADCDLHFLPLNVFDLLNNIHTVKGIPILLFFTQTVIIFGTWTSENPYRLQRALDSRSQFILNFLVYRPPQFIIWFIAFSKAPSLAPSKLPPTYFQDLHTFNDPLAGHLGAVTFPFNFAPETIFREWFC